MTQMTGIIDSIANNGVGKGSHILIQGNKYGIYDPSEINMDSLRAGEEVRFEFNQKGQYMNIDSKAGVQKTGNTGAATPQVSSATSGAVSSNSKAGFPVDKGHYSRAIIRQNSLTNAVNALGVAEVDPNTYANNAISLARQFEAYSSGDLDESQSAQATAHLQQAN